MDSADMHLDHPQENPFDRRLLRVRQARALQCVGRRGGDFLLAHAARDIGERMAGIVRTFPLAVDLTGHGGHLARALHACGRVDRVVSAAIAPFNEADAADLVIDEEWLPYARESVDALASALTLQFVNDLQCSLVQLRRALRPDGLLIGAIVGAGSLTELRDVLLTVETETVGGASPRVAPLPTLADFGGLLQRAGFALPVLDQETLTVRYDTMFDLIGDLRAMGATNVLTARDRRPLRRALALRGASLYAERFADPDGRIRATFELLHFAAWAPHESQQKPLPPGSATRRLADALGTREYPTGDAAQPTRGRQANEDRDRTPHETG